MPQGREINRARGSVERTFDACRGSGGGSRLGDEGDERVCRAKGRNFVLAATAPDGRRHGLHVRLHRRVGKGLGGGCDCGADEGVLVAGGAVHNRSCRGLHAHSKHERMHGRCGVLFLLKHLNSSVCSRAAPVTGAAS